MAQDSNPAETLPRLPEFKRPRKRVAALLGAVVLMICLGLTGILWREAHRQASTEVTANAIREADSVELMIRNQLSGYELILHGNSALRASVSQIQQQQWSAYVHALDTQERFPGILGVGLALYFDQSRLMRMQDDVRRQTGTLFSVWPSGIRPEYGPIVFLAPENPANSLAYGYDMYSEPLRHEAMQRAMESGQARVTAPLQLKQDGDVPTTSGLMYLPIYRNNVQPATLSGRRAEMIGWSYIPYHSQPMIQRAIKPLTRNFLLRVDDSAGNPTNPLFTDERIKPDAAPVWISEAEFFGRTWRFRLYENRDDQPTLFTRDVVVLLVGIPLSLALAAVIFILAMTRSRAYSLAQAMTQAHRRSDTLLRTTMMHSAIGKSLLDANGSILQTNLSFQKIMGMDEAELVGRKFDTLFDKTSAPKVDPDSGMDFRREVRRIMRKDGSIRHLALTYSKIPETEGVDVSAIVQVQDITESISNEARIQSLNRTLESRVESRTRELTEANEELKSFAYTVSHDLRAPLRAIEGFSQVLIDKHATQLDEAGKGYLTRVRTAALRMSDLIEAMLKVSRLSQSKLERQEINLSEMAHEVQLGLEAVGANRNVKFEIEPGLIAQGDPALITNLLQNLMGNAWKFTRGVPEPVIRVGRATEMPDAYFVEDNGAGFPEAFAHKLFLPFQRLHTEREFEGNGIGLTSVKRVIERHGGRIQASGTPGKGARFVFSLPPQQAA